MKPFLELRKKRDSAEIPVAGLRGMDAWKWLSEAAVTAAHKYGGAAAVHPDTILSGARKPLIRRLRKLTSHAHWQGGWTLNGKMLPTTEREKNELKTAKALERLR